MQGLRALPGAEERFLRRFEQKRSGGHRIGVRYDREDVEEILKSAKEVLEWVKQNLNL